MSIITAPTIRGQALAHDWMRTAMVTPLPATAAAETRVDALEILTERVRQMRADALQVGQMSSVDRYTADLAWRYRIELDGALLHLAKMQAAADERLRELGGSR